MSRPRKKQDRWNHPHYAFAYCYNRKGMVYTCVKKVRKSTGLYWKAVNRQRALNILTDRVEALNSPIRDTSDGGKIYDYIDGYLGSMVGVNTQKLIDRRMYALKEICVENLELTDHRGIKAMLYRGVSNLDVSDSTKKSKLADLNHFFNYLISEGAIDRNPVPREKFRALREGLRRPLQEQEFWKVVDALQSSPNSRRTDHSRKLDKEAISYILFLYYTGCRAQEALNLRKGSLIGQKYHKANADFSFVDGDTIQIYGKGARWREFPIQFAPEIDQVLLEIHSVNPESERFFNARGSATYRDRLSGALKKIGVDEQFIKFHSIRKLAETRWREQGVPVEIRSLLAGHSIAVQVSRYLKQPSGKEILDMLDKSV